jgi:hypothetical protein
MTACSFVPVDLHFRRAYCLHLQGDETPVYFNETTRCYKPSSCHLHTRCRENLKSHTTFNACLTLFYDALTSHTLRAGIYSVKYEDYCKWTKNMQNGIATYPSISLSSRACLLLPSYTNMPLYFILISLFTFFSLLFVFSFFIFFQDNLLYRG